MGARRIAAGQGVRLRLEQVGRARRLHPTERAPETNPASARGAWYPLLGEWTERRMHWVRLFRDGLAAAGVEVRVDEVGPPGRELSLLWARSPEPLVERAE